MAFKFEILEIVENKEDLLLREQCYIDTFYDNCVNCYNIAPTAGSSLGRKFSEETKIKMSLTNKGKAGTMTGRHHTDASKLQMSMTRKGKQPRLGLTHTEKTKAKLSIACSINSAQQIDWNFISPNGLLVSFRNLNKFCREHPELKISSMRSVNKGRQIQHQGWTRYIEPVSIKEENT